MEEHPNVDLVRRGYAAFAAGDMETLTELIADDAVWHIGGRSSLTGDYKGREAIFTLFARVVEETEGTLQIEVHDVVGNDEHVVALVKVSGTRKGRSVAVNTSDTAHLRDGQATEYWSFPEDQYAFDEFWA